MWGSIPQQQINDRNRLMTVASPWRYGQYPFRGRPGITRSNPKNLLGHRPSGVIVHDGASMRASPAAPRT